MSTTKNALIRYKVLDKCFRNPGKRYYIEDLIRKCEEVLSEINPSSNGISRRQILYDISFMESSEGWSIELLRIRDDKKVYYRYADMSFSINNMPLNEIEINHLKEAIDTISQFRGMPQFEWVQEVIPKLKQGISTNQEQSTIIDFQHNQYLKGIEQLGTLYNSIFYKKVLSISYQPFESEAPSDIVIHPYFLKQYNNRWFLFGYNPEVEKYNWNLAIDRIVSIKVIKEKYQKNNLIDWLEYFEDMIGVTKSENAEIEKIVLHFNSKTGKYVETKPLHGSQKSKWINPDILEVTLQVIINYELERLLLSYAESVKVIKPIALKKTIKNRLLDAWSNYK